MALTDNQIRAIKPAEKDRKYADAGGLHLLVRTNGGKVWRWKYRIHGREKLLTIGRYPDISLKDARSSRDEARRLLAKGTDPSQRRGQDPGNTFEAVARHWYNNFEKSWADSHKEKILGRLQNDLFPWIGSRPIDSLTAPDLLACLRRMADRGALDSAHRVKQNLGQIFRYAATLSKVTQDPSSLLKGALPSPRKGKFPTVKGAAAIGLLLRNIDDYCGDFIVRCALRLAPLVFVRPSELREAPWDEFDFDEALWTIPESRMKGRLTHLVPLSRQALDILKELKPLTGTGAYVFAGRSDGKCVSENTLNAALRRMGYMKEQQVVHGFRHMASTELNGTLRLEEDVIERQMAHVEKNKIRGIYNEAEYLPERIQLMQDWADYLDKLRKLKGPTEVKLRA